MTMDEPKDSEALSSDQLANMPGGFAGQPCPHCKDQKHPEQYKWLDEGKFIPVRSNHRESDNVSGNAVHRG